MSADTEHRERVAEGLEQLAALIRSSPDVAVKPDCSSHTYQYCAQSELEVEALAAALGVAPSWNDGHSHYCAEVELTGRVHYAAVWITRDHMARHAAASTYAGSVDPAEPVTA